MCSCNNYSYLTHEAQSFLYLDLKKLRYQFQLEILLCILISSKKYPVF